MKSQHEIQNTRINYAKVQHKKTWVIFNYHNPLIKKYQYI
jgi:hypothetical protein